MVVSLWHIGSISLALLAIRSEALVATTQTSHLQQNVTNTSVGDDNQFAELVCYTGKDSGCRRCHGICVMDFYEYNGEILFTEGGCHKPTPQKPKFKCSFAPEPYIMKYSFRAENLSFEDVEIKDDVFVYKKCCFTSRCNSKRRFKETVTAMQSLISDFDKTTDDTLNTDARVTTFIFLGLVAAIIVYSAIWMIKFVVKRKNKSPDYRQVLDEALVTAGKGSAETVDMGATVTGQLSITETTEVILYMVCPPTIDRHSATTSIDSRVVIVPPREFQAAGNGHDLVKARRLRPHYLQSLLFRMIEHGPYHFPFRPMELLELFDEAQDVFQSQKSLVHVNSCVIFGDLRGSYADLHRWLQVVGWPPKTSLLFLGNTIDEENNGSLEVIALISALKIAFPDDVFLLRGATETLPFVPKMRFPIRTASSIGRCVTRMCSFLPTAAIVMDRILAVPSGITPLVDSLRDLTDQRRPTTVDTLTNVQRHLIFNQPSTAVRMYRKNKASRGEFFGFTAVERIRADLHVNMLVRGGAPVPEGYCPCWDHTVVSLWSTPTGDTTKGAVLVVSKDLEVTPLKMNQQMDGVPLYPVNTGSKETDSTGMGKE